MRIFTLVSGIFWTLLVFSQSKDTAWVLSKSQRQNINTFIFQSLYYQHFLRTKNTFEYQLKTDNLYNPTVPQKWVQAIQTGYFSHSHILSKKLQWKNYSQTINYLPTNFYTFQAFTGVNYMPLDSLQLQADIGWNYDQRDRYKNHGWATRMLLQFDKTTQDKQQWKAQLNSRYYSLQIRNNFNYNAKLAYKIPIKDLIKLHLAAQHAFWQVEDFFSKSIQRIRSDSTQLDLFFTYQLTKRIFLSTQNYLQIHNRRFYFRPLETLTPERNNSQFRQFAYQLQGTLSWKLDFFNVDFSFKNSVENRTFDIENTLNLAPTTFQIQRNQEKLKDYAQETTQWTWNSQLTIRKKCIVTHSFIGELLRFDTPSKDNFDDRDVLLYSGEQDIKYLISRSFKAGLLFSGIYRHIVYIFAQQSKENYAQYIIKMSPYAEWSNKKWEIKAIYQQWSMYNVHDFSLMQNNDRSTRLLSTEVHLQWQMHPKWQHKVDVLYSRRNIGKLNWKLFTEIPIDTTFTYDYAYKCTFSSKKWSIYLGYHHFLQQRRYESGYKQERTGLSKAILLKENNFQTGPTMGVEARLKSTFSFSFENWLQWYFTRYYFKEKVGVPLFINFTESQLFQTPKPRIIPYFLLNASVRW
ncbi:MAG: hypothetical protein NZ519_07075 [Bacteroidia bacterium]|nr:hypothetical protein [Bacteroidia bacterium]MDW8301052.1 hypothetical protein [Bacteroidia bacterium]